MKIANINIMMLKTLRSLRETGSISRTAEQLHVTQSAVSHAVKALEVTLGTPVVTREPRGVCLTATGMAASESAMVALDAIGNILQLASSAVSGSVNIAAINCVSRVILTEVITQIRQSHPGIEITLFTGTDQEVEHWVRDGIADIGIAYNMDSSTSELLFEDQFYLVTPLSQPIKTAVEMISLNNVPIIVSSSGCEIFIQELFDQHQQQLAIKTTVSDTAALFSIVASGYGVSLVPGLAFPSDWGKLVSRRAVSPTLGCSLRLMCAKGKADSSVVKVLSQEIREVAKAKQQLVLSGQL